MGTIPIVNVYARLSEDFHCTIALEGADGSPLDLAGLSLTMQVRPTLAEPAVFEISTQNGSIEISDDPGEITIAFAADDIRHLAAGSYVQDLVASQGEARRVVWEGSFNTKAGVTRW